MKRREFLERAALAAGCLTLPAWAAPPKAASSAAKRKVLFYTRSAGFEHSVIRREGDAPGYAEKLMSEWGPQHGYEITVTKDGSIFDSDLKQFDALFFFTTGDLTKPGGDNQPPMSTDGKQRLLDYVAGGRGFVGSHCATDTFHSEGPARERQTTPDPFIAMLGGEFVSHGAQQESRQILTSPNFPGTNGLGGGFRLLDEWYSLKNFADNLHVILAQDTSDMKGNDYQRPNYPATWARKHHEGRVFYTSMGHREDVWPNPTFQKILAGGLAWACGDAEFDAQPNMQSVTPDAHTMPTA